MLFDPNHHDLEGGVFEKRWKARKPKAVEEILVELRKSEGARALRLRSALQRRQSFWVTAEVEMTHSSRKAQGYGSRVSGKKALTVAFAECWERFIATSVSAEGADIFYGMPLAALSTSQVTLGSLRPFRLIPFQSTNGFAAGASLREALTKAAAELFERHCVLSVWNQESRALKVNPHLSFLTRTWASSLRAQGWRLDWYELGRTSQLVAIACLARHEKFGARFDSCASFSRGAAVESAMVSVFRMIHHASLEENFEELWKQGEPLSHLAYYSNPARLKAFDFLDQNIADVRPAVHEFAPDLIPLWAPDAMPAVGLAQWSKSKDLVWGEKSLQLCQNNPYPHPIA